MEPISWETIKPRQWECKGIIQLVDIIHSTMVKSDFTCCAMLNELYVWQQLRVRTIMAVWRVLECVPFASSYIHFATLISLRPTLFIWSEYYNSIIHLIVTILHTLLKWTTVKRGKWIQSHFWQKLTYGSAKTLIFERKTENIWCRHRQRETDNGNFWFDKVAKRLKWNQKSNREFKCKWSHAVNAFHYFTLVFFPRRVFVFACDIKEIHTIFIAFYIE